MTTLSSVWCWLVAAAGLAAPADEDRLKHFDERIAPLLASRCLECHHPGEKSGDLDLTTAAAALQGGESGPAVVPGKLAESRLIERVLAGEMPPAKKKPLAESERKLLADWIAGGAAWRGPIDRFRYTSDARAGYDWWSLRPVGDPEPPAGGDASRIRNPIDRFVQAKLREQGLGPSPEADRRTLIRRLSIDLLGLPPTPAETEAFLADESPQAYDRLVERLLASPHYGERWARHWLDVARFGESQGFERDKLRTDSWRYRDWVIEAFQRDLPYDQFMRQQVAGDALAPHDPRAIIATGFLVAGPYDEVGQTQQSAAMRAVVREDDLEDILSTVGQTFLGLTVQCGRCHDHKFDPISQLEYYRLQATFAGVRHGSRESLPAAGRERAAAELARLDAETEATRRELTELLRAARGRVAVGRRTAPEAAKPEPIARWEFDGDLRDAVGGMHGTAHGAARVVEGRLELDGTSSHVSAPLKRPLTEKTLEAWVRVGGLDQRGGGVLGVSTPDGAAFDAIVFGEREPKRWVAGSDFFRRTRDVGGEEETAAADQAVHVAITYAPSGRITIYRQGRLYGRAYDAAGPAKFEADKAQVLFGMRHPPAGANRMFKGQIERAMLYDRELTPAEVAASANVPLEPSENELVAAFTPAEATQYRALQATLAVRQLPRGLLSGGPTYAASPAQPPVVKVLRRGNPQDPLEVATPGTLAAVRGGRSAEFDLRADAPEAERRLRFAEWLADPANPLPARVLVNRLWHHHFGVGLVETPNDFGFNGGRPTHPELLDWLARRFIEQGWSIKQAHRLIVGSHAYRQAPAAVAAAQKVDAENRLLWRKVPQRLDAETARDCILAAAGELNPQQGGPGFQDFKTFTFNSQFYEPIDPEGFEFQRRTIYRTWVRSGKSPFLDVFDCPDPSTATPRRAVTTTPLQALALLNNSFVLRMCDRFAHRLRLAAGDDVEAQVTLAYRIAYARAPLADERSDAAAFVRDQGLAAFARAIFNSNEFLYVD